MIADPLNSSQKDGADARGWPDSSPRMALLLLIVLTLFAAWLRLDGIDQKSISHPELFVPNIELPSHGSVPRQRYTLTSVISGSYSGDVHPPGYYVMMWVWTKMFGTSAISIRLPGALLGVASIPLLVWVGKLAGNPRAGWIGATLLAANGGHIYFSQYARMFTLECALGLLATVALLLLAREKGSGRYLELWYVAAIVLGVNVHVFFWPLFLVQIAWALANSRSAGEAGPRILRAQALALILGLPALAFSIYQSTAPVAVLSNEVLMFVREYFCFSFLLPIQDFPDMLAGWATPFSQTDPLSKAARYCFLLLALVIFWAGLRALKGLGSWEASSERRGPSRRIWYVAAGMSSISIVAFVLVARKFLGAHAHPTLWIVEAMAGAPPLVALLAPVAYRLWQSAPEGLRRLVENPFFQCRAGLVALQGWLPFAIIAVLGSVRPLLNERGLLFAAPYLLFVLAAGILEIVKSRAMRVAVACGLAVLHAGSVMAHHQMPLSGTNYKAFAAAVIPRVHSTDLVLFWPNWYTSPIYFYMKPHEFTFVGSNFARACQARPDANLVVLVFRDQPMTPEIRRAVGDYQVTGTLHSYKETAIFYTRRAPAGPKEMSPAPSP